MTCKLFFQALTKFVIGLLLIRMVKIMRLDRKPKILFLHGFYASDINKVNI